MVSHYSIKKEGVNVVWSDANILKGACDEVMEMNFLCLFCLHIARLVEGGFISRRKIVSYRKFVNEGVFNTYLQISVYSTSPQDV